MTWVGGHGVFSIWGDLDGGKVRLLHTPDGGATWLEVINSNDGLFVSSDAARSGSFELVPCMIRAVLFGAGDAPSASIKVSRV
jgi:photosystem II stability/assembly factor-like uncharacterized protein